MSVFNTKAVRNTEVDTFCAVAAETLFVDLVAKLEFDKVDE